MAGILVALVSGPLGVFVAWQRISFFGHTLAHSALMGVALGLYLGIDIIFGVLLVSTVLSLALSLLYSYQKTSRDTWMALIAHGSMGISLVLISFFPQAQQYIMIYLFGDILALSPSDLFLLVLTTVGALGGMIILWKPLLKITVNEGIAWVEGTPVFLVRTLFMILVALVVSVSLKVLGGLLITAMLILPAATARRFVSTPETMCVMAILVGVVSVILGLMGAQIMDTPPAASMVVATLFLFILSRCLVWRRDF